MPFPAEIDEIEEHSPNYGRAIVFTTENHEYQVCMACGCAHPMNASALAYEQNTTLPEANKRISEMVNGLQWDNNICEQRHPPVTREDEEK